MAAATLPTRFRVPINRFNTTGDDKSFGVAVEFGGGLALYDGDSVLVGAVGVSGDTSCANHNVAWRTHHALGLDFVPVGISAG